MAAEKQQPTHAHVLEALFEDQNSAHQQAPQAVAPGLDRTQQIEVISAMTNACESLPNVVETMWDESVSPEAVRELFRGKVEELIRNIKAYQKLEDHKFSGQIKTIRVKAGHFGYSYKEYGWQGNLHTWGPLCAMILAIGEIKKAIEPGVKAQKATAMVLNAYLEGITTFLESLNQITRRKSPPLIPPSIESTQHTQTSSHLGRFFKAINHFLSPERVDTSLKRRLGSRG